MTLVELIRKNPGQTFSDGVQKARYDEALHCWLIDGLTCAYDFLWEFGESEEWQVDDGSIELNVPEWADYDEVDFDVDGLTYRWQKGLLKEKTRDGDYIIATPTIKLISATGVGKIEG